MERQRPEGMEQVLERQFLRLVVVGLVASRPLLSDYVLEYRDPRESTGYLDHVRTDGTVMG